MKLSALTEKLQDLVFEIEHHPDAPLDTDTGQEYMDNLASASVFLHTYARLSEEDE